MRGPDFDAAGDRDENFQRGRSPKTSLRIGILLGFLAALGAGSVSSAQTPSPTAGDGMAANALRGRLGAIDTAAAMRGATLYRSSCSFCHGGEGRGAQGPDLTASLIVLADPKGEALGAFLKVGKPASGMPAFPNFASTELTEITAFLQARATEGRRSANADPVNILVGDVVAGRSYFDKTGRCSSCHSPDGDLKGIGSRYNPMALQARMINPRVGPRPAGAKPQPPTMVTVTGARAAPVTGRLVQINDFYVTLIDPKGVRRTFARDNDAPKVVVSDPMEAHRQMLKQWTDKDMWNVTAYLASLK